MFGRVSSIGLACLLILAIAGPASAAKPFVEQFPVDEQFTDEFLSEMCGFTVTATLTGHVVGHIWFDAEGNPTREVWTIAIRGWLSAGGATLRFVDTGMDKVTHLANGGVRIEVHGNVRLITLKGKGAVDGATGRFVFTITPLLDEEGNPVLDEEGDPIFVFEEIASSGFRGEGIEALCEALAPPA